jgi:hypothetical protein
VSLALPERVHHDDHVRVLKPLWADLTTGKNIDLYVTFVLALTIGLLGVLGVVDTAAVAAATLATLALVAFSSAGNRRQMTALEKATRDLADLVRENGKGVSADQFLVSSTSGLDLDLGAASDIRLVGVTLSRTIRTHFHTLERRMERGAAVKIALVEPGSEAVQEAARRSTVADSPEIFENRLRPTVDLLRHLAANPASKGRLEIRFLGFVPVFGLAIVDPDDDHGGIQVDIYAHRSSGPEPVIRLARHRDPRWFTHFLQEFDRVWSNGRTAVPRDGKLSVTDAPS